MSQVCSLRAIEELLQQLDKIESDKRVLIIGALGDDRGTSKNHEIIQIGCITSAAEVDNEIRADIAVVVNQLESMSKSDGTHLLSKLRDLISNRVLLLFRGDGWTSGELLALGYQQIQQKEKRPSKDGRCYLYDPNYFHEPREWNNKANWANPENFNKYRW